MVRRAVLVASRVGALVLFALLLVRPTYGVEQVASARSDVSVLVVVDRTTSMDARDADGRPRFDRVRADLATLLETMPDARFALVSFATTATLDLPFTSDRERVEQAFGALEPERAVNAFGSRLDRPLDEVRDLMARSAPGADDTLLVLMSDGENTAPGRQASYAPVAQSLRAGVVLGYGSETGGPMRIDPAEPDSPLIIDNSTGETAVSRLDADNLRGVADELGAGYVHRDSPEGMETVVTQLLEARSGLDSATVVSREVTWLFASGLLLLLLVELRSHWRDLLATLRERRAAR